VLPPRAVQALIEKRQKSHTTLENTASRLLRDLQARYLELHPPIPQSNLPEKPTPIEPPRAEMEVPLSRRRLQLLSAVYVGTGKVRYLDTETANLLLDQKFTETRAY